MKHYDFGGYATRFNVKCTDGRTIRHSAFEKQLPTRVPLVWQHRHDTPENCIGHADLEARPDGVYAYCSFTTGDNVSPAVGHAQALVAHGDIDALSIYANDLIERGKEVMHGVIKEVSLVLAGANPGAKILETDIAHADGAPFGAQIYPGADAVDDLLGGELMHADEEPEEEDDKEDPKKKDDSKKEKTVEDILNTLNDEQMAAVTYIFKEQAKKLGGKSEEDKKEDKKDEAEDESKGEGELKHADEQNSEETVGDVLDTLNEKQKAAVMYLLDQMKNSKNNKTEKSDDEEDNEMKHNAFEGRAYSGADVNEKHLSHAAEMEIWRRFLDGEYKTLKSGILQYANQNGHLAHSDEVDRSTGTPDYGIEDIEWLFPDAKVMSDEPMIIDRRQEWVKTFMSKTTHLPYSRVKTIYADITADDARAKGYAKKGALKVPEVIKLLKHKVQPTTVYKAQKFDKDDLRDITSFDPLKWIDAEMTAKLHEELALSAMLGDGREDTDPYKVDEECIIPITKANPLFTIYSDIVVAADATDAEIASEAMDQSIRAKKDYKGSGDVTLFTTENWLSEMFLLKDVNGRRIYESEQAICSAMRVQHIETVELMEGATVDGDELFGVIVNPKDYAFGSDKGSAIETFKQFDIDYNQEKILKETRCSGALRVPYSAIVLKIKKSA